MDEATEAEGPAGDGAACGRAIGRELLRWYDRNGRELPWRRETPDPYAVWVSEVMLQQTRVGTVEPYFERWMRRFPDVASLADADLEDVFKVWEGLGYYARARRLHAVARLVRERGGTLPSTSEELRALPGIGSYTAGAIASIAFGANEPAVDANARRVLARVYDLAAPAPAELERLARSWLVPDRAGDVNQAVMDLGATVCTPRDPACGACPLAEACLALRRGTVAERPRRRARAPVPARSFVVGLVRSGASGSERMLVRRRAPGGFLGGLWEFPTVPGRAGSDGDARDAALESARAALRAACAAPRDLAVDETVPRLRVRHAYSHFVGTYEVLGLRAPRTFEPAEGAAWVRPDALANLAMPAAFRRICAGCLGLAERPHR
ncbi:MAG TPA: A/G-specific adenine glycosylase [Longimicrobiales bacterium]|nr:A/G-specific adenine glycosylase [Longimicrobiales bacterium]